MAQLIHGTTINGHIAIHAGNMSDHSIATTTYVGQQITNLINGAPGALDTLNELAAALGNNASFATSVTNGLAGKLSLSGGTMTGQLYIPSIGTGVYEGAIQIREQGYVGSNQSDWNYAPAITFHWGNRSVQRFGVRADGLFAVDNEPLALRSWVTSQSYLTALPSHNHDDRYYTESESDSRFAAISHTHDDRYYTESESDSRFAAISHSHTFASLTSKPTTISGYGITDAITTGNIGSQSVSYASQVGINYNNNSDSTYQLLWGSGNSVYGTAEVYVNPSNDHIYASGFYASSDIYLGTRGTWLSSWLNQSVQTGASPSFVNVYATGIVGNNSSQTRDKLRVWDSSQYTIGMKASYTYGHLGNEYAMSFQMNNNSNRGFWWGHSDHTDAQGAAALTTDGRMVIAQSLSIGEGSSAVTPSSAPLYVRGQIDGAEVLAVDGVNGRLFTVTDSVLDTIYSVNTIAGLPIIEALADSTVKIGKYGNATTFNNDGTVTFQNEGIKIPYYNGGHMWFRTNTHWASISGIDVIGGGGEFRISSDTGSIDLRVDGGFISGAGTTSGQWDVAYNKRPTAISFSGGSTKTLTLTQGDGSTLTAAFTDIDTDTDTNTDGQTLSINGSTLSISGGNSITIPSGGISQATADGLYQPLENQRLSTGNGPTFTQVYNNGWFRNNNNNEGFYNQANGNHFYSRGAAKWGLTGAGGNIHLEFRSNHESTLRGVVYADTSNQIGFLNNGEGWSLRANSSNNVFVHGTDLTINADNAGYSNINMNDGDEGTRIIHCNSNRIGFLTQAGSWGAYADDNANWVTGAGMYAAAFYDNDNSAFFVDPAGSSRIRNLYVGDSGSNWSDPGGWGTVFWVSNAPHAIIRVENRNDSRQAVLYSHQGQMPAVGSGGGYDFRLVRDMSDRITLGSSYITMHTHVNMSYNSLDYVNQIYQETGGQPNYMYANNSGSYGSLRLTSTRGGWYGIYFDSGSTLMMNSNETGFYRQGYGWQWRWENGTAYVNKNAYGGGTSASVLDSSNYTTWAASRRSEGSNYVDYSRYVYNNGAYSGSGWIEPSDLGVRYANSAGNSSTVGGVGVSTLRGLVGYNSIEFYVNGDANRYYPVLLSLGGQFGMNRYSVSRGYSDPAPWDPIGTGSHRGGLTLTFDASSDIAWGGNDKSWRIIQFAESYTNMVAGMALPVTGGILVWLRGGGAYYRLQGPNGVNHSADVYYDGYTGANGANYPVRTDLGSVDGEIRSKWPIRGHGDGDIYVNNNAVIHAGNIGSQSVSSATSAGYLTGGDSRAYMLLYNVLSGNLNTYDSPGLYSAEYNGSTNRPISQNGHFIQISDAAGTDVKTQWYYSSDGANIYMRVMWGNGSWRNWRTLITDANIGSQSVNYASSAGSLSSMNISQFTNNSGYITSPGNITRLWAESHSGDYYIRNNWTGTHWHITSNHPSGVRVAYADSAGSAGSAGSADTASRANRANGNFYIDDNYGNTVVGVYSASRLQGVWAMGDAYKLAADGSSASNHYGIAWSHPNHGGTAGRLTNHGMLIQGAGTTWAAISDSIWCIGDITAYSDARVKANVEVIDNPLDRLSKVRGVTFTRTDLPNTSKRYAGVIAQEMREALPEAVTEDGNGELSVSYGNTVSLLIESIKAQQIQIEELKAEVKKLRGE